MAKKGNTYFTDKDFTDAEVLADPRFTFPCSFILRRDNRIVKETFYDLTGAKSVTTYQGSEDKVLTLGTITATTTTLALELHSSGVNSVLMSGVERSKTEGDDFTFAPVAAGKLKYVLLYALPDPQLFHIIEGVEGNEAIYPDLPPGALLIKAVLISEFGALLEDADSGYKPLAEDPWRNIVINSNAAVNIIVASSPSASFNVMVRAGVTAPKIAAIKTKVKKNTRDGQEITFYNDSDVPVALLPGDYEETLVYTTFPFADNYEIKPRSFAKFKRKENKYHELAGGSASFPETGSNGDVLEKDSAEEGGVKWSNRLTTAESAITAKLDKPTTTSDFTAYPYIVGVNDAGNSARFVAGNFDIISALHDSNLRYTLPNFNSAVNYSTLRNSAPVAQTGAVAGNDNVSQSVDYKSNGSTLGKQWGATMNIQLLYGRDLSFVRKFAILTNVTTQRMFIGLSTAFGAGSPINQALETLVNIVGVCMIENSDKIWFIYNNATGSAILHDTGFTNDINYTYKLILYQDSSTVKMKLLRENRFTYSTDIVEHILSEFPMNVIYPGLWCVDSAGSDVTTIRDYGFTSTHKGYRNL